MQNLALVLVQRETGAVVAISVLTSAILTALLALWQVRREQAKTVRLQNIPESR